MAIWISGATSAAGRRLLAGKKHRRKSALHHLWEVISTMTFMSRFTKDELAQGKGYCNFEMTEVSIEGLPGASVFYGYPNGDIYHTYSVYARGGEEVLGAYMLLDLTPKGRNETGPNFKWTGCDVMTNTRIRGLP